MEKLVDNFVIITDENDGFRIEVLPCVLSEFGISIPDNDVNYHLIVNGKNVVEMKLFE